MLTLMKGDEGVDCVENRANQSLLFYTWDRNACVAYKLFVKVVDGAASGKHTILVKHLRSAQHVA